MPILSDLISGHDAHRRWRFGDFLKIFGGTVNGADLNLPQFLETGFSQIMRRFPVLGGDPAMTGNDHGGGHPGRNDDFYCAGGEALADITHVDLSLKRSGET